MRRKAMTVDSIQESWVYIIGELNSAVMIRFLENDGIGTYFKAGGGITSKSDCRKEYEEVLQKVYLPFE